MRLPVRLFASGLAVLALGHLAPAATVTGRVRDAGTSSYLLGATVNLRELSRDTTTGPDGSFVFNDVPAGTYTLTAGFLGYADKSEALSVTAGGARPVEFALASEITKLGAFVVEGNREGQARALQQKRTENMIMDAVAADAVGKFPDGNAAEALRRVPGVSLEIDQSEGRFVVIRGIDASLNNVTLNGQQVGSPAEQGRRGMSMDSVPADLISRLEVIKAVTPDRDHNAIGGTVNIVTQSAFDRAESFAFGSFSAGYNDFSGEWGWRAASATFGRVLDAKRTLGIVAGVSYSRREYASQTSDAVDYSIVNGFSRPKRRNRSTTRSSARGSAPTSRSNTARRKGSSSTSAPISTNSPTRKAGKRPATTSPSAPSRRRPRRAAPTARAGRPRNSATTSRST